MPIPQERRNVPAINKSDLLLEMPQKEQSFIQCVCVYIYIYIHIYIYIYIYIHSANHSAVR